MKAKALRAMFSTYLLAILIMPGISGTTVERGSNAEDHKSPYHPSAPFRERINPLDPANEADGGHQNPLVQALIVSNHLQIPPKLLNRNYPQHQPINPYVALLLSHYGKYVPVYGNGRGLYAYNAANDYHNNRPFGSYKVHEDQRR